MNEKRLFNSQKLTPTQTETVRQFNEALLRLTERRKMEVVVEGCLARSKLAWSAAVLQQALLYRMVGLAQGMVLAWNSDNLLASILPARAIIETHAILHDFSDRLNTSIQQEALGEIHDLVVARSFSSRDVEWLSTNPTMKAVNILTLVDKIDRLVPGMRQHYDALSERCHPNSLGHWQMFATLNRSTGTVAFSETKQLKQGILCLLPAMTLLRMFEDGIVALEKEIENLSDLQNRLNPVDSLG